ncbi:MAG TPA: sugar phosphate isomerase/epimerase, partial [Prosthecobacter sp.]|nr:sugar phosphate isomerase/epimerase [Prosthecobacter sp.]
MSNRRHFLSTLISAGAAGFAYGQAPASPNPKGENMQFGLVTYMWGAEWDLPTLIKNCEDTQVLGVEL